MKRLSNLYEQIISLDNLRLADEKARKGKLRSYGVKRHDKNREANILALHESLKNKTFVNSKYEVFIIKDPKERLIYRLPYYPDRILHHAIMNILEPIWVSLFTEDTYSCIKDRGIHKAAAKVKKALKEDPEHTTYCLKMDIVKFYPSIDHDILKTILRKKIKDKDLLWLLDVIIDSADGVPIGNYLSQYFANIYLAYFDHWIKEVKKVRYYFRYADDIVILGDDPKQLHKLRIEIEEYLHDNLKLSLRKVDPKTGKLRLSHKALLPKPEGYQERSERPRGDRNDRGERRERPERHDRGERRERPERRESRPERTEDNQETGSEE